jgi:rubrerythrin
VAGEVHYNLHPQPIRFHTEESYMRSLSTSLLRTGLAALAVGFALSAANAVLAHENTPVSTWTVNNCQTAYLAERNAAARYRAYSQKADQEGYSGIASLFRTAAAVEQVHARNQEMLIRKLGGTPLLELEVPRVQTTRENLQSSAEWAQRDEKNMYAALVEQARKQSYQQIILVDTDAQKSAGNLAQMFSTELQTLDAHKDDSARSFYVCEVDGHVLMHLHSDVCKTCFHARNKFRLVS